MKSVICVCILEQCADSCVGCTFIQTYVLPRNAKHLRGHSHNEILIYRRLMSDYEVTLVNDNSMSFSQA